MARNGTNGANGAAHKEEGKVELPDRAIEAIALDPEAYDRLKARLASDADEDTAKLRAFFAKSETVYR